MELFAMLCKQYNLNPIADGDHHPPEGHSWGSLPTMGILNIWNAWNGLHHGRVPGKDVKAARRIRGCGAGERRMVPGQEAPGRRKVPERGVQKCFPMLSAMRTVYSGIR